MAINSVGSSTTSSTIIQRPQRPDPEKVASDLFAKIDTDGQGSIDKTELQAAFDKISSDGKGSSTDVDNFMSAVDTDNDGKISKQEMTDGFKKVADELDAQFNASRMGPPPAADGQGQAPSVDNIFSSLDTKNQGYLDKDELLAAFDANSTDSAANAEKVDQIFKAFDTDGDNKITKDELSAGMDKLAAQQDSGATNSTQSTDAVAGAERPMHAHGAHGGGGAKKADDSTSSTDSSTVYEAADTNQDGTVSLQELIAYQMSQGSSSASSSSSSSTSSTDGSDDAQNSLQAMLKMADQLAQTYGQFSANPVTATSQANSISELA